MQIKTVTVVGANGTMGRNVSAIFASFGNAKVYMVSRTLEKSQKARVKAYQTVKADSIKDRLVPADYSMLEECVKDSDLVFESTAENLAVKLSVTSKVAKYIGENTICCSGTSGLSITTLAEVFPENLRKNFMGIHIFNPPYNMTLCEITPTKYTDRNIFEGVRAYLTNVLFRTVVEVKDSPAFLGNRIGFQFINEALQYAEKYKDNGGIDYIDAILGPFTGRNMAPLVTSDFVGLDVHKAIVNNLYENTNDYSKNTFILPEFAEKLIAEGHLGRKAGDGLYKVQTYENGLRRYLVYDISTDTYRDSIKYTFPFVERMVAALKIGDYDVAFQSLINNHSVEAKMCLEFLMKYVIYSLRATELVGYDIHSADDVMATGFNWCPPLAMIQALFGVDDFKALVKERISDEILSNFDLDELLSHAGPSRYDFRKYMKAKK